MTIMDYICEQPELFRKALAERKELAEQFCQMFIRERPNSVYLIASGTSGNAARAAAPFLERVWNMPVYAFAPSRVNRIWGDRPLLLLISQGGRSINMLNAAEKLKKYPRIAVTGSASAGLNTLCDCHVLIPCGEETAGPKTKGYTMTILLLYLLALETGCICGSISREEYETCLSALKTSAEQFADNIGRTKAWLRENEDALANLRGIYLAGKGLSESIAREGALKVMETLMISAAAFDFEEYLHGPSCSLGGETGGFYLLPSNEDPDYRRMREMADYHREICPLVFIISGAGDFGAEPEEKTDGRDCCLLSSGHSFTRPFEEILPFQLMAALIPEKRGIDGRGMECFKAIDRKLGVKDREGASDGVCIRN